MAEALWGLVRVGLQVIRDLLDLRVTLGLKGRQAKTELPARLAETG